MQHDNVVNGSNNYLLNRDITFFWLIPALVISLSSALWF